MNMNQFDYTLLIQEIDHLSTKKAKADMFKKLLWGTVAFYEFKTLTYLIKKYNDDLPIGTTNSDTIKRRFVHILKTGKHDINDLTEHCDSDFTVTQNHFDRLMASRYTTFQMAAYAAKHIKVK